MNLINGYLYWEGPDLDDNHFRRKCATIDAVERVKFLTESAVRQDEVALAISIDIINVFNSLPWLKMRDALYLKSIAYATEEGDMVRRQVNRRVSQGSVLGFLLWDLGYNALLEAALPARVVDNTFLPAGGIGLAR